MEQPPALRTVPNDLTFENGRAVYRIALSSDGIITGAMMQTGP
jgi:hypothetical protein